MVTTTLLATAWSDSLEDLELLQSLSNSLEIRVVKNYMYFCISEYTYFIGQAPWSDSLEDLELLQSLTVFLEIRVVKIL